MSIEPIELTVSLTNQKVQFTGVSKFNPERPIAFDYVPPVGDGQGYGGLELLLMSLTGCVSTAIVFLLRKMNKNIAGFQINAKGIRREQPLSLRTIFLEVLIDSNDIGNSDMQSIMKQTEEISPVWNTLKNNVEIVTEVKIRSLN